MGSYCCRPLPPSPIFAYWCDSGGDTPLLFGASLTALNKDGGVRPIAVGCTLRRLVGKIASTAVIDRMGTFLSPLQLGYGTPLGAETAVHSAWLYL